MAGSSTKPTAPGPSGYWMPLCLFGVIAVIAGMLLPQLLPADPNTPNPLKEKATTLEKATSNDLKYTPPAWPEAPSFTGMFLRLGIGTVLVLGLCVGTLWYGKRWLSVISIKPTTGELKLVETLHLGNRCCLHLVQMSSRQVLVGTDASGVKSIVTLDNFEQVLATEPTQGAEPEIEMHRLALPDRK